MTFLLLAFFLLSPASASDRPAPLPGPLAERPVAPAEVQRATLSNGLEVIAVPDRRAPLFELRLVSPARHAIEPQGKEGLARALYELLAAGSHTHDADTLSAEARRLGVRLRGHLSGTGGVWSAQGLSRNLDQAIALWASPLTDPAYPEDELQTWKRAVHDDVASRDADPGRLAQRIWWELAYGEGPLGRSPSHASIDALERADLMDAHGTHLGPGRSILLIGGDVHLDELLPLLEAHLGAWRAPRASESPPSPPVIPDEPVLFAMDFPGASQSHVRLGIPLPPRLEGTEPPRIHPDHFPLLVANQAFAGAFTSRVNLNLREDKGYTYGARCRVLPTGADSWLYCATSVQTEVTGPALRELQAELSDVQEARPLTEDEIDRARRALARRWPASYETVSGYLDRAQEIWHFGLPPDWIPGYVDRVTAVDSSDANQALRSALSAPRTFWLVIGDLAVFHEELEPLGLHVVQLDAQGQVLPENDPPPSKRDPTTN